MGSSPSVNKKKYEQSEPVHDSEQNNVQSEVNNSQTPIPNGIEIQTPSTIGTSNPDSTQPNGSLGPDQNGGFSICELYVFPNQEIDITPKPNQGYQTENQNSIHIISFEETTKQDSGIGSGGSGSGHQKPDSASSKSSKGRSSEHISDGMIP